MSNSVYKIINAYVYIYGILSLRTYVRSINAYNLYIRTEQLYIFFFFDVKTDSFNLHLF